MTNQEILYKWYSPGIKSIYGFMYGHPYINTSKGKIKDQIIKIPKKNINLGKDRDCLIYIWGWPGPDGNIYEFKDYGITWAFTKEEIDV